MEEFASYDAFMLGDPRRLISNRVDLGITWGADGKRYPVWSLHHLEDTGEVYAEECSGKRRVRLLGVVPSDEVDHSQSYARRPRWYATLEDQVLAGWADEPHRDLSWVSERLQAAS